VTKDIQRRCPHCGRIVPTVRVSSLNRTYFIFHTTKPRGRVTCKGARQPVDRR
jgi:adenine-specific DNA methylase